MIYRFLMLFLFFLISSTAVFGESIFLKDGSIIKGKVAKETDKSMIVKTDKEEKVLSRDQVLRVLYIDDYEKLSYVFLKDNSIIECYIVEESRNRFLCRKKLNSAEEISINKEDIRFISKEKVSLYQMQKQSGKPKLISDRKNKFINLLGLRAGALYVESANKNIPYNDSTVMFSLGLYYLDRFFEFHWEMNIDFDDKSSMLHQYIMNYLPFNMFNVGLGLGIGYTQFDFRKLESNDGPGVTLGYQGFLVGLTYRYGGWFRLGFYYSLCVGFRAEYNTETESLNYEDQNTPFNCYAYAEVFVWSNLSVMVSYRYLGATASSYDAVANGPTEVTMMNHCISVSVSFGLNMF